MAIGGIMPKVTIHQLLDALQTGWGQYVAGFERLSPAEQAAFLQRQGYSRFHDLLAHICAWWEETLEVVTAILEVRDLPERHYNVDAFNATAIAKFQDWKESDLLTHYENLREALLYLMAELPEEALTNRRIAGWLHASVIEHLDEHRLL
jgi:hypothetical protein